MQTGEGYLRMTIESELSTSKLAPESHMEAGQKSAAGNSDSFMISVEPQASHQCSPVLEAKKSKKLALLPLIFLIYFEVAGGPYGEEAAVGAAGPLFAILGFLIFPFIWSIPEALVTAELATTYPGNGGFVLWANAAFGPFWGSLMGTWKFLSGVVNLASYPVLCIDYLKLVFPIFASGVYHHLAIFFFTMILSFLNYTGLTVVGYTSVALGLVSLSPFAVLTVASLPKIQPKRWISLGQKDVKKNWPLFFNTLFWNLNFWDNVSTLAGEVEKPEKTYPKALFSAGIFTCLSYFIPLLAVTGATSLDQSLWVNGYFADAAVTIAGKWLKYWIEVGSVLSAFGLYEAQLTSAFQIVGMSNIRVVPKCLGLRSKWFNTPWVGILLSTLMVLAVSNMNFTNIIASGNILYSLGMLLVFDSFLWLRWKMPKMKRPYRVPLPFWALCIMCLIPSGFLIYIMTVATITVYEVCASLTAFGVMWYFLMKLCKSKKWIKFDNGDAKEENKEETISNLS